MSSSVGQRNFASFKSRLVAIRHSDECKKQIADGDEVRSRSSFVSCAKGKMRTKSAVSGVTRGEPWFDVIKPSVNQEHPDLQLEYSPGQDCLAVEPVHHIKRTPLEAPHTWEKLITQSEMMLNDLEPFTTQQTKSPCKRIFNSSKEFLTVLEEFYYPKEVVNSHNQTIKHKDDLQPIANRIIGKVKAIGALKVLEKLNQRSKFPDIGGAARVENARRRWGLLRSYVRDLAARKRMRKASMNWTLLRHTVKGMGNLERSRHDLYVRYGLVPVVTKDGKVIKENMMMSNRPQSLAAPGHVTSKHKTRPIPSNTSQCKPKGNWSSFLNN
ncbi:uncharacterized protein LOC106064342 [Biomphalaria glabrata]|uniref:Uncharacterized protein LOC106064342 n=1 Tax=Biomphalaria glabrata TaxID=6526 RepID=A0A9U8EA08_BIOGL|nr:uncharacterized protein LOC106064342 [Biomphalaria glabrata]